MKGSLLLLLLLFIAMPIQAQYYEQCYTVSGFTDNENSGNSFNFNSTIRSNASKEFALVGNTKLFRVSKEGTKLWEKDLTAGVYDYAIDGSGNVIAIHNSGTKLIKYNSNGSMAWEKTFTSQSVIKLFVDDSGNVYATGYDNNTSGLLLVKYASNGTLAWQKIIGGAYGNSVVANSAGDVFVLGIDYNNGGDLLVKYSSNGTFQWQKAINYFFFNRQLMLAPDGNVYAILNDDFSTRVLKVNPSTGNTLNDELIDMGRPVATFGGGNSLFILGTVGDNSFGNQYYVYKLNSDFTGGFFDSFSQQFHFDFPPSRYRSVLVESNGNILLSFMSSLNGEWGGVLVRMTSAGAIIGETNFFNVATTGAAIDHQGYYVFSTDFDCLKKLTLCTNLSVSITGQPANQTICSGTNAQFTVSATGQGLLYQWKKGTQILSNNSKYSGVNSTTLTVKVANVTDDAGTYTCEVFDGCFHTVTSQSASLSFIGSSSITAQPANVSQCPGTEAVFQITTSGGQNVKYQWKKGTTSLTESATVVGTQTNKLTLKGIVAGDAGQYHCEVTSDCFPSALVSQQGILTVLPSTTISSQPAAITTCAGSTAVFTVVAGGTNLTYQWRKGGVNLTESSLAVGTKSTVLSIKDVKTSDAGDYSCVITGACGNPVTSSNAAMVVTPAAQITQQPVSKEICAGGAVSFSVAATGSGLSYSWKKGNTPLTNGGKYSGVNTATLNISSTTVAEEGQYGCTVSSSCGNEVISTVAQLSIGSAPSITGKSADLNLCAGELAKMSVTISGGLVTYQWKKNGVVLTEGNGIIGSNARELFIQNIKSSDAGNYTCSVSSGCGAVQVSGAIKLELTSELVIDTQRSTQRNCKGEKVTMVVPASGIVQTYQWKKNGVNLTNSANLSGVKTSTLIIQQSAVADEGFYSCELLSPCGKILLSADIKLEINPQPDLLLLDINCDAFPTEWASLVMDINNVFGEYSLLKEGSTTPLSDVRFAAASGQYTIIKSNGVCADSIQWNNACVITGVEYAQADLEVLPNPSSGTFTVQHSFPMQQLEMYDMRGVEVLSSPLSAGAETQVDASQLADGIYYVTLFTKEGKRISKRILIQR